MPEIEIPHPLQFNPLKHHLLYIRCFIADAVAGSIVQQQFLKLLKHTGTSVMDVYTGNLKVEQIADETIAFLNSRNILKQEDFRKWAGINSSEFRLIVLSDGSRWTVKYHKNLFRYVHIFPARSGPETFRVKANTIKSAILYLVHCGKDYVTVNDLNNARALAGLSPIRDITETEAIAELIEILRSQ